jgi:uncharacterized membrane protein
MKAEVLGFVEQFIGNNTELITFIISTLPVFELRGGIPYGLLNGLSISSAYVLGILGNLLPVVCILLAFTALTYLCEKYVPWCAKWLHWLRDRSHKKLVDKYESQGLLALVIFVAIPLPMTGAWTGSIAAAVLDINKKKAFAAITLGVCISGVIVTGLTQLAL